MAETPTEKPSSNGDGSNNIDAKATPLTILPSGATSFSKKVLENIDKILNHMEVSREDLFSVNKSLLEAFKALNNRLQASETENSQLTKSLLDAMATCNSLQEDVLCLREAYSNETARSDKLTAEVEQIKEELRQQSMSKKKVSNDDLPKSFSGTVEEKVGGEELSKKDDETDGPVKDENACVESDKSDEKEKQSQESNIVKPTQVDNQVEMSEEDLESTDISTTSVSTVEEVEAKLTTEAHVISEGSEDDKEDEEEEEEESLEEVAATKVCAKPVFTSSLTTASTTTTTQVAATVSQKPEIISHSITHDESVLTSYNDQPDDQPASQLQKHHFEETTRLWFNSCQLCKCSIIPTTKFYVCTGCKIKVDKACFESDQVQAMDVPCISVNLVSLMAMEMQMSSGVGHLQPQVPSIIVECCKQIEEQAMAILKASTPSPRFSSKFIPKSLPLRLYKELDAKSSKEVEKLFTTFARTHNVAELKLSHVHPIIVSGLLVRLLQSLGQPLVDSKWWSDCLRASNSFLNSVQRRDLFTSLLKTKLEPVVHRHTLAFLLLHLKRVLFKLPTVGNSSRYVVDKQQLVNLFAPLIAPSFSRGATTPATGMLASADNASGGKGGKQAQMKMTHLKRRMVIAMLNLPQECLQEVLKSGSEPQTPGTSKQLSRRTTNFGSILMTERQRHSFTKHMSNIY